jgi:hypothetical protein
MAKKLTHLQKIRAFRKERAEWPSIVRRAHDGDEKAAELVERRTGVDPRPKDKPTVTREPK